VTGEEAGVNWCNGVARAAGSRRKVAEADGCAMLLRG
jgi:hypothetical protein